MSTQPHIAFVDPFSSTEFLASNLKSNHLRVSAIYTQTNPINNYFVAHADLFDTIFSSQESKSESEFIARLKKSQIDRIYYGNENSVAYADRLAQAICADYANPCTTSSYRSNKYAMQEALVKHHIPAVKQIKIQSELASAQKQEISQWQFPTIIKPVNNAATVGVMRCESMIEITDYLKNKAQTTLFGNAIEGYVIQECLQGIEYFIDTFSHHGEILISGIQSYKRHFFNGAPICLYSDVVKLDSLEAQLIIQYVRRVLMAVDMQEGFAHTEIMLTSNGPFLIEVNPRISGAHGLNNKLFQLCGLPAQTDLLITTCRKAKTTIKQENNHLHGRKVFLQNYSEKIMRPLNLEKLETLPSYKTIKILKTPGTPLFPTKNLTDTIALLLLVHRDHQQIEKDYQKIMDWETNDNLYLTN